MSLTSVFSRWISSFLTALGLPIAMSDLANYPPPNMPFACAEKNPTSLERNKKKIKKLMRVLKALKALKVVKLELELEAM